MSRGGDPSEGTGDPVQSTGSGPNDRCFTLTLSNGPKFTSGGCLYTTPKLVSEE